MYDLLPFTRKVLTVRNKLLRNTYAAVDIVDSGYSATVYILSEIVGHVGNKLVLLLFRLVYYRLVGEIPKLLFSRAVG